PDPYRNGTGPVRLDRSSNSHNHTPSVTSITTVQWTGDDQPHTRRTSTQTERRVTANKHRRSIMITVFVYCLITILFWLPLQGWSSPAELGSGSYLLM